MAKSLVGRVKNKKFAFFWLLIGGSIGNMLIVFYSPDVWPVFLPQSILSILMVIITRNKTQRPKIWLGINFIVAIIALILIVPFLGPASIQWGILLPDILIIFGCIFGIMNW